MFFPGSNITCFMLYIHFFTYLLTLPRSYKCGLRVWLLNHIAFRRVNQTFGAWKETRNTSCIARSRWPVTLQNCVSSLRGVWCGQKGGMTSAIGGGDGVSFQSELKSSQTNIDSSSGVSELLVWMPCYIHRAFVAEHRPTKRAAFE
jgi:hypothetical protein